MYKNTVSLISFEEIKSEDYTMAEVSICIICYNQEKYIEQAIESVLMQKCTFATEIIICDDCSTDNTPNLIRSYVDKYPKRIKAYPAQQNMGMLRNWERALKLCSAKYIALLEGDDFWNDENKLQKQYRILETYPNYSVCFTNARNKYENGRKGYPHYVNLTDTTHTTADLLLYNFIPTCSVLMRNNISTTFFHPAYFNSPFADWIIHILNSKFGDIYFLNEFTCTYRVHNSGVWGGIKEEKQLINKLNAIACISIIVSKQEIKPFIKQSRRQALQNICAFYKQHKKYFNYLAYRIELLIN